MDEERERDREKGQKNKKVIEAREKCRNVCVCERDKDKV